MTTLNLQVGISSGTSDQQSGQDNTGRVYTNSGACTLGRGTFMPGSHTSNDEWTGACRFTSVTIPKGATITSANFILKVQSGWDAAALGRVIKYYVSAEAADNAAALASTGANLTSTNRPRSTATLAWTQNTTATASDQTASITSVIQEIVNRAGWSSGNAIVILVDTHEDTTTGEWQEYEDYTSSPTGAPKLQIVYTAGGGTTYNQSASGGFTPAGTILKRPATTKTGGITPTGALLRQARKTFTGGFTPSGALLKRAGKAMAGTLTSAGVLVGRGAKVLAGTLTSAGTILKRTSRSFAGGITPSGTLATVRAVLVSLSGTLTSAGTLTRQTRRAFTAALTSAGALLKQAGKRLAGGFAPTGTLSTIRAVLVSLSGALTTSGALVRQAQKPLAGTLTSAGVLVKRTARSLAGGLTPTGALTKIRAVLVSLSGAVSFAGGLTKQASKTLLGNLATSGGIGRRIGKGLSAVLSFVGALTSSGGGSSITPVHSVALRMAARPALTMEARPTLRARTRAALRMK